MTKKVALLLAPFLGVLIWYLLSDIWGRESALMAAIMVGVVTLWLFDTLSVWVPPLCGLLIALLFRIETPLAVLDSFTHKAVLLLLGSFVLAKALEYHQLSYHLTHYLTKHIGQTPYRFVMVMTFVAFVFSMWISNSASTAMILPLLVAGFKTMKSTSGRMDKFKAKSVLFVGFSASLGGIATPIGSPTNLLGLGMMSNLGLATPDFFSWMLIGLTIALICYGVLMVFLKVSHHDLNIQFSTEGISFTNENNSQSKVLYKAICFIFGLTVFLWVLPGILSFVLDSSNTVLKSLPHYLSESNVALLSAGIILLVPFDIKSAQKTVLPLTEIKSIDWGTLVLFGASIALGGLLLKSGLIDHLASWIAQWSYISSQVSILFLVIILSVFLSDLMSNTATVNLIVPLAYALAQAKGIDPRLPVLGAVFASSYGFLLPVSTPPNALAYATGLIKMRQMIRYGIFMDILGITVIGCVLLIFTI